MKQDQAEDDADADHDADQDERHDARAVTDEKSCPIVASTCPSCTSCTVRTTMPVYQAEAISATRLASSPPTALSRADRGDQRHRRVHDQRRRDEDGERLAVGVDDRLQDGADVDPSGCGGCGGHRLMLASGPVRSTGTPSGRAAIARSISRLREVRVLERAREVGVVGRQVEVAVPAEPEQDHALVAGLLRRLRLLDHRADRVGRLGRRDDALGARELHAGGERLRLAVGARLDEALVHERRDQRRVAVVAQAAGVDGRRARSRGRACTSASAA